MFFRTLCIAAFISSAATASDDAVEIPLGDIWAYSMPGTKDVRKLAPAVFGDQIKNVAPDVRANRERDSLVNQLALVLAHRSLDKPALPGFAVSGTGEDALRGAFNVLVKTRSRRKAFHRITKSGLCFSLIPRAIIHSLSK
jgi:hypothetical protein